MAMAAVSGYVWKLPVLTAAFKSDRPHFDTFYTAASLLNKNPLSSALLLVQRSSALAAKRISSVTSFRHIRQLASEPGAGSDGPNSATDLVLARNGYEMGVNI
jgi:hypothetical protein